MLKWVLHGIIGVALVWNAAAVAAVQTLWAAGVNSETGWYDFNKNHGGEESRLCWAITASNLIAWWQDNQETAELPPGVPMGEAVWHTYRASFNNDGSDPDQGVRWWFTGGYEPTRPATGESCAVITNSAAGAYYKHSAEDASLLRKLFYRGRGADVTARTFSQAVYAGLLAGDAFWIGVAYNRPDGSRATHSLTMWGADVELGADGSPAVVAIYMTDSDDGARVLHRIPLQTVDGMPDFVCPEHPLYGKIGKITITTYTGMRCNENPRDASRTPGRQ